MGMKKNMHGEERMVFLWLYFHVRVVKSGHAAADILVVEEHAVVLLWICTIF